MSALAVFYAGAVAYDHANHVAHWTRLHLPLLLAVTVLAGFVAALYLRRTADQRAWHASTHGDDGIPEADDNRAGTDRQALRICWAQWPDAPTWNDVRKETRKP